MCYNVYLATDCPELPASVKPERYSYQSLHSEHEALIDLLTPPNRWYLSSFGCCSCHFRFDDGGLDGWTLQPLPPSFSAPLDWCPEDEDNIEATAHVFDALCDLVSRGHKVEVLCFWQGAEPDNIETIQVSVGELPRDHFRFFEDYRFLLVP